MKKDGGPSSKPTPKSNISAAHEPVELMEKDIIDGVLSKEEKKQTDWARAEYVRRRAKERYEKSLLADKTPKSDKKSDAINLANITFDYQGNPIFINKKPPRQAPLPDNVSAIEYEVPPNVPKKSKLAPAESMSSVRGSQQSI